MSNTMDTDEDHVYVFLDFNEKIAPSTFSNKMFLRVANLDKLNPLVQVNDLVFQGSYDECVGTNLFFEEVENPPPRGNLFNKETAIRLKPVLAQTKIVKLKQKKLPRKVLSSNNVKETVLLNLNQDYQTILDKLEQGVLNIDDLAQKTTEDIINEQYEDLIYNNAEEFMAEPEREVNSYVDWLGSKSQSGLLEAKYERLKRLARRPVRRMKSPELVESCDDEYKFSNEYHNLEKQILQSSDAFRTTSGGILENSLVGGVDIDRCVLQGLIPPSNDLTRVLSSDEQSKVMTLDNFANLSQPARYLVLRDCVQKIEDLMKTTSLDILKEKDDNGRTIQDICNIFRKLLEALKRQISPTPEVINVKVGSGLEYEENYVKYKYKPSEDFVGFPEMFDEQQWTDDEGTKHTEESDSSKEDD